MPEIRPDRAGDSIEGITDVLNRAYKPLGDMGLRYVATWQTPDITLERVSRGTAFVAVEDGRFVGTISLYPPSLDAGCDLYCAEWHFGQFGVDPELQCKGIGKALYEATENEARNKGAITLALDTAKPAAHLIALYKRWGFEVVGEADWRPHTNYLSVLMAKTL